MASSNTSKSLLKRAAVAAGTAIIDHYSKNRENNQVTRSQSGNSGSSLISAITAGGTPRELNPEQDQYSPENLRRRFRPDDFSHNKRSKKIVADPAEQLGPVGVELREQIYRLEAELELQKERYGPDDERIKETKKKYDILMKSI